MSLGRIDVSDIIRIASEASAFKKKIKRKDVIQAGAAGLLPFLQTKKKKI
jgi:hypothetical protein